MRKWSDAGSTRREAVIAYVMLTLMALFWAGNMIAGRAVIDDLPPLGLGFWRSFGAFLILAPIGLPRMWRDRHVIVAHWRILAALGFLGTTCFALPAFIALHHTEAVNATLIGGVPPIIIVVLSWLVLGQRITRRQGVGVATALAGLVVIVARGDAGILTSLSLNAGDLILLISVCGFSLFAMLLPRRPRALDLICFTTVLFFVGSLTSLPFHLWEIADGRPMPFNLTAAWAVGFIALFPSVLAQLFWVESVRRVGPAAAGNFIYLAPVFGAGLAVLLLGETFAWFHGVGIALIFCGIYLATAANRSPSAARR